MKYQAFSSFKSNDYKTESEIGYCDLNESILELAMQNKKAPFLEEWC